MKRLDLDVNASSTTIGAINTMSTMSRGIVRVTIQSVRDGFRKELTCLIITAVAKSIPLETFPRSSIKIPSNIKLADPSFHVPQPVDLLIGAGPTLFLFCIGQINLSHENYDLYLQKTRLGWMVAGGIPVLTPSKSTMCHATNLENQLTKFWMIEEIPTVDTKSQEEIACKAHYVESVYRNANGRYMVGLSFRDIGKRLGESRSIVLKRLASLERKLNSNMTLKTQFTQAFEEYVKSNHVSIVENPIDDGYYMPHHAVFKDTSDTTKIRVVFDASAKTSTDVSLNDVLVDPTIQDTLFSHLIHFRTYRYVISAALKKCTCKFNYTKTRDVFSGFFGTRTIKLKLSNSTF